MLCSRSQWIVLYFIWEWERFIWAAPFPILWSDQTKRQNFLNFHHFPHLHHSLFRPNPHPHTSWPDIFSSGSKHWRSALKRSSQTSSRVRRATVLDHRCLLRKSVLSISTEYKCHIYYQPWGKQLLNTHQHRYSCLDRSWSFKPGKNRSHYFSRVANSRLKDSLHFFGCRN